MPKHVETHTLSNALVQYKVFVGSPSGLDDVRSAFRDRIQRFNETHALDRGVYFRAIGWEDTLGGVGRPQEIINADLQQCDHAIFVLHDRWGTATSVASSGTEEEFVLAEKLYASASMLSISIFFRAVSTRQMSDPGADLTKVLNFKASIQAKNTHLYHSFDTVVDFDEKLEKHLASWLNLHVSNSSSKSNAVEIIQSQSTEPEDVHKSPSYEYLISEALRALKPDTPSGYSAAEYLAGSAAEVAPNQQAKSRSLLVQVGAMLSQKKFRAAFVEIDATLERSTAMASKDRMRFRLERASALVGMGRGDDAIAELRDLVQATGDDPDFFLTHMGSLLLLAKQYDEKEDRSAELQVYEAAIAKLLTAPSEFPSSVLIDTKTNRIVALKQSGAYEQAILAVDDLIASNDWSGNPAGKARVLALKAAAQSDLAKHADEVATNHAILQLFGFQTERFLNPSYANSMLNIAIELSSYPGGQSFAEQYLNEIAFGYSEGMPAEVAHVVVRALDMLGTYRYRGQDLAGEISFRATLRDRFLTSDYQPTRRLVAKSIWSESVTLRNLGRNVEAADLLETQFAVFAQDDDPSVREHVARGVMTRGIALSNLGRPLDCISNFDAGISWYERSPSNSLREQYAGYHVMRAMELYTAGQLDAALTACDDCFAKFGSEKNVKIRNDVFDLLRYKGILLVALKRNAEAFVVYDIISNRLGVPSNNVDILQAVKTTRLRASLLESQGNSKQANVDRLDGFRKYRKNRNNSVRAELSLMVLDAARSIYKFDVNSAKAICTDFINFAGRSKDDVISASIDQARAIISDFVT